MLPNTRRYLSDSPLVNLAEGIQGRIQPGLGDRILWIHGYTLDSSSWGELWRQLPDYQHIGIDLPGHGASAAIDPTMDLRSLGIKLANLCSEQEIQHIIALSFGTITAIQTALEFHGELASLTLAAPAIAGGPQDSYMAQVYGELFQLNMQGADPKNLGDKWLSCRAWDGLDDLPGLRTALSSLVWKHSWAELQSFAIRQFTFPEQPASALQGIIAPTLVLVGQREMLAYRQCAEILAQTLPNCRLQELPNVDHLCLLQAPDDSAKLIAAHLRQFAKN